MILCSTHASACVTYMYMCNVIALCVYRFAQVCGFEEYLLGDYPLIQYKVCDSLHSHVHVHVHCTCSLHVCMNSSKHH